MSHRPFEAHLCERIKPMGIFFLQLKKRDGHICMCDCHPKHNDALHAPNNPSLLSAKIFCFYL